MDLEFYLSPANMEAHDKAFEEEQAAFDKRVEETTAKRLANNLAMFGEPEY